MPLSYFWRVGLNSDSVMLTWTTWRPPAGGASSEKRSRNAKHESKIRIRRVTRGTTDAMTTTVSFNIEKKREWEQAATSEPFSKKLEVTTGVETRILLGVYTVRAWPNPLQSRCYCALQNHGWHGTLGYWVAVARAQ